MADSVSFPALPFPLTWQVPPEKWTVTESSLTADAPAVTDLFIDPQGAAPKLNAPRLLGSYTGDFQFSARVTVDFASTFDAGVLALWIDESHWAKLCFEFSPLRQPMIVSVVTEGTSDDANSSLVEGNSAWLRMSRLGAAFAFHASRDGKTWDLVRHFGLPAEAAVQIGFLVQAPTGSGSSATFEEIAFTPERLGAIRSGK